MKTNDAQALRNRLETSLAMFRRELAAGKWANGRSYRHIEALVQGILDKTYFSPYHLFTPMPDEITVLQANLDRLNQVIWVLSGKMPESDFKPLFHVRPYHPAYFIVMYDEQMKPESQNRLDDVITRLKANLNLDVEIVRGLDDGCATCVYTDIYRCTKDPDNQQHWDGVNEKLLAKQGLSCGQRLSARNLMRNAVKTMPVWEDTCGVCVAKQAHQYEAGRQAWMKLVG